jgi:hypothetical protein
MLDNQPHLTTIDNTNTRRCSSDDSEAFSHTAFREPYQLTVIIMVLAKSKNAVGLGNRFDFSSIITDVC